VADIPILVAGTASTPTSYEVPNTQEILLKVVSAVFDASSATTGFEPTLEDVTDAGIVVAEIPASLVQPGGLERVTWFPGAELDQEAAGETVGVASETVYYDTPNANTPLTMSTTLISGVSYVLVVEGTWSLWNSALGTGTPEADAMFPGSGAGRVSTQVGLDADTCFAKKTGSTVVIGHTSLLTFSLDNGSTYAHVEPLGGPFSTPQAGHLYRYELTGQGHPLKVLLNDINAPDNYGKLKFTLQVPSGTGTGSGSGSLVPPTDATLNGDVLEVVGGEPGISVREVVAALGVNRTSLYPVVRQLVSDGLLHKDGRGLWPVSA